MRKHILLLLAVIALGAFLRFWKLGIVPTGVTHDELGFIYNSYSIAKTGKNVFGEFLPFLTWMNKGGFPFLPIPIYLAVPFYWFLPLTPFVGRLPTAILGVFDLLLIYLLVKQLLKNDYIALLSSLFLAISPWHLHLSRSAYETNYSLFFYLLGVVLFFRSSFLSLLAFLLANFSYRGMNPILIPLVFSLIWFGWRTKKINYKQAFVTISGLLIILCAIFLTIKSSGKAYLVAENSIFNFNSPKTQETIDTQIREATGPLILRRLFLNKPAYLISQLRDNYLRSYSPEFLFLHTEANQIYSIWSRGRVYFIDLLFISLGILYFWKVHKKVGILLILFFLIGGLPGMIGGPPYSGRNLFMSVILPIFSAGGCLLSLERA